VSTAQPKISLVTPSFNQIPFLRATLSSVLDQRYPNLEYVVVDGGSTDGSRDLIAQHADALAWWCSEPDHGMYDALNKGFAPTTGDIMGWLNSDDLHLPWTLKTVAEIFSQFPQLEWLASQTVGTWSASGQCLGMSSIGGFSREAFLDGGYLPGAVRQYGWIPQESTFWRRSLWEKAGGQLNATFRAAGDFELWARFYEHAELVGTLTPLAGFRTHPEQKSRAMDAYLREARAALADAQKRHRHAIAPWRRWLLRSHLASLPGLRRALIRRCGYRGLKVEATAAGAWQITPHRFL